MNTTDEHSAENYTVLQRYYVFMDNKKHDDYWAAIMYLVECSLKSMGCLNWGRIVHVFGNVKMFCEHWVKTDNNNS